jgi:plasmid stabilization system protein ParE
VSRYRLTPEAENDLFEIWLYIARDSVRSADRLEAAIYDAFIRLAKSPLQGHIRQDLTRLELRFWTLPRYRNYMIVYDPNTQPLQIIRIINGARNAPLLLRADTPS